MVSVFTVCLSLDFGLYYVLYVNFYGTSFKLMLGNGILWIITSKYRQCEYHFKGMNPKRTKMASDLCIWKIFSTDLNETAIWKWP